MAQNHYFGTTLTKLAPKRQTPAITGGLLLIRLAMKSKVVYRCIFFFFSIVKRDSSLILTIAGVNSIARGDHSGGASRKHKEKTDQGETCEVPITV